MDWWLVALAVVLMVISLVETITLTKTISKFEMECLNLGVDMAIAKNRIMTLESRVSKMEAWVEENKDGIN
ncbi:MAG: hypothetical protein J6Y02_05880 [Pseudobutyrivibrio sp.]|nr:hypothetical protein [Pseudobutyrivibrio sp.]